MNLLHDKHYPKWQQTHHFLRQQRRVWLKIFVSHLMLYHHFLYHLGVMMRRMEMNLLHNQHYPKWQQIHHFLKLQRLAGLKIFVSLYHYVYLADQWLLREHLPHNEYHPKWQQTHFFKAAKACRFDHSPWLFWVESPLILPSPINEISLSLTGFMI